MRPEKGGFGIISAVIAISVLAIASFGVASLIQSVSKASNANQTVSSRDLIKSSLQIFAGDPLALRRSASVNGNEALMSCAITGNPFPGCTQSVSCCNSTLSYGFTLQDSSGTATVAGNSPTNPIRYDSSGNPCTSANGPTPKCGIEAYVSFTPICANGNSCSKASYVRVDYTLRQAPNIILENATHLNTMTGSIVTPASWIAASQICFLGQMLTQINADGSTVCTPTLYSN